jgi:hypothetical protein
MFDRVIGHNVSQVVLSLIVLKLALTALGEMAPLLKRKWNGR